MEAVEAEPEADVEEVERMETVEGGKGVETMETVEGGEVEDIVERVANEDVGDDEGKKDLRGSCSRFYKKHRTREKVNKTGKTCEPQDFEKALTGHDRILLALESGLKTVSQVLAFQYEGKKIHASYLDAKRAEKKGLYWRVGDSVEMTDLGSERVSELALHIEMAADVAQEQLAAAVPRPPCQPQKSRTPKRRRSSVAASLDIEQRVQFLLVANADVVKQARKRLYHELMKDANYDDDEEFMFASEKAITKAKDSYPDASGELQDALDEYQKARAKLEKIGARYE
jgi:hypothetical protein